MSAVEIPSSQAGYERLLRFAAERAAGRRCWVLEGTGCYGAGLASFLADHGEWVTEIDRPKRTGRTQAKSDTLDAIRAGREALSRDQLAARAIVASARRCRCCSSPGPARSRSPPTPAGI